MHISNQYLVVCRLCFLFLVSSHFFLHTVQASSISGKQQFTFSSWQGSPIEVWAYAPTNLTPNTRVLFVMHGTNRDADRYRDEWASLAQKHNLLLIVPQFNKTDFPRALSYNLGNVFANDNYNKVNPEALWAFSAIEPLFDFVKDRFGITNNQYSLYGHSAGAQFVHRFLYFVPSARVFKVVSANAGWYTLPDFTISFPYGLKHTPVTSNQLAVALQKPVVVLLGEADNDPMHPSLRRADPAMRQGQHRLARGYYFYEQAKLAAKTEEIEFGWQLRTVPNVGHKNNLMAEAAITYLVE